MATSRSFGPVKKPYNGPFGAAGSAISNRLLKGVAPQRRRRAAGCAAESVEDAVLTWNMEAIFAWDVRSENNNDFAIKDIDFSCRLDAPSGTTLDFAETTIYEIIPAHSSRTFRNFKMEFTRNSDQATAVICRIPGFKDGREH
jgi:hypothetical protein